MYITVFNKFFFNKNYLLPLSGEASLANAYIVGHFFLNSIKLYSTLPPSVSPVVIYKNANKDKVKILNDNRGKAGIYQWVNKINGKTYIGSSVDLYNRLRCYLNPD